MENKKMVSCFNCKKCILDSNNLYSCDFCETKICGNCYSNYTLYENWSINFCDCGLSICTDCMKKIELSEGFEGKKDKSKSVKGDFNCFDYFTSKKEHLELEEQFTSIEEETN